MLNPDPHILIHALCGDLTNKENNILVKEIWSISPIVIWEIAKLSQLNRIEIDLDDPGFLLLSNIHIWTLSLNVYQVIKNLDYTGDPAGEIIEATSIVHNVPLVTRDKRIKKSKMIPMA